MSDPLGDILILQVGDVVPADCRILDSTEFSVDNSGITGESEPIELDPTATHEKQLFSKNMAFTSACVVRGTAKAVVTRTVSILNFLLNPITYFKFRLYTFTQVMKFGTVKSKIQVTPHGPPKKGLEWTYGF